MVKLKLKTREELIEAGVSCRDSDFLYAITGGGWMQPEDFSDDPKTVKAIRDAIKVIMECDAVCPTEEDFDD